MLRPLISPFGETRIPSLRQFRYFARIVELGSMTRASEHLNVAQTALGSQMRQLEEELGVELLLRHSRGVAATKAGQLLYKHAQAILANVDQCLREIADLRAEQAEVLRVGASGSVVHLAASDFLARVHSTMPNVAVALVEEESLVLFEALKRGELDLVLAHELPEAPGLTRTPWLKEDLLFVTAGEPGITRPVAAAADLTEAIELAEGLKTELTLPVRLDGIRKIIETAAGPLNLKYQVTYQVQSPQALKILIADNSVASILPFGLALNELRTGALRARRIISPPLSRTLYLARSSYRLSDRNEAALAELLTSIRLKLADALGPLATLSDPV